MACKTGECVCSCKIAGLAHIAVFVKDIERSIGFYKDVLGFECYHKADLPSDNGVIKLAFLTCGTCELELVMLPVYQKRQDGLIGHIALSVENIDAVMKCLSGKGVVFETKMPVYSPTIFDNGVKNLFFRGPDGEHIEICEVL